MSPSSADVLKSKQRAIERARANGWRPQITDDPNEVRPRLPPGQSLTLKFPVLDLGIQPEFEPETWRLEVGGLVENTLSLCWADFLALPHEDFTADFHCVTRWSKYDVRWRGVRFSTLVEIAQPLPEASFVLQRSSDGYSTNLPLHEICLPDVFLADQLEEAPVPREHGGPVRLIVPSLYAWKGAKFLNQIQFLNHDEPGFWEMRGYHNHGDPWKEERFADQWW